MSIRARLALGAALITALVVLVVAAVQFLALGSFLSQAERTRLELLLPTVQRAIETAPQENSVLRLSEALSGSALPRNVDVRVLRGARVIALTRNFPVLPLNLPPSYAPRMTHSVLVTTLEIGGQPTTVQLASDVLGVVNPLRAYLRALAVSAPLAALLSALLSFVLAGRLLRPLARLELAAAAVGQGGDLRSPLPGANRQDELGSLARVLQTAFGRVAEVRAREASFTRAAAHDLRSPLAALKTRLQGALAGPRHTAELREDIGEALSDVERMRRLTEHLLLLARGKQEVTLRPLNLAVVAGEAVDRARERAPGVPLEFEAHGNATLLGDAALLTHLLDNLIGNGVHHGAGAAMRVEVVGTPQHVCLRVCDAGPGVPENALPRLTEAFYRADASRSGAGHGLGLALAQQVADVHGASLHFETVTPSGLRAVVTFERGELG